MRWIDHTPGPCPVPQGTLVDVQFRWDTRYSVKPGNLSWGPCGAGTIIRYRVRQRPDAVCNVYADGTLGVGWHSRDGADFSAYVDPRRRIGVWRVYLR